MPDLSKVEQYSENVLKFLSAIESSPRQLLIKPFAWERQLIENSFAGSDSAGRHLGVYMTLKDDNFTYEIRGLFENTVNSLPLTDEILIEAFHMKPENMDVLGFLKNVRDKLKLNVQSQYTLHTAR